MNNARGRNIEQIGAVVARGKGPGAKNIWTRIGVAFEKP